MVTSALWTLSCARMLIDVNHGDPLDRKAAWVLLPVLNFSETPQAGERTEAILTTLIRAQRLPHFDVYQNDPSQDAIPVLDENPRYERALEWARRNGYAYGVTGTVIEWQYRNGLDGQPAISVSIRVVDVTSGKVVFSASGARSGEARETLGVSAQILLKETVAKIKFKPDAAE